MRLKDIQAGAPGVLPATARAGLTVLSWGYGVAWAIRREARGLGLGRPTRLAVPVVSIGNVVAGGTGKTPFTAWLASELLRAGRKPGILSRGYGPPCAAGDLSDEGAVLRHLLGPAVPQVEDPDRLRGGRALLVAHPETDVVLLDDGFQHRRLARDLDVVLLDATCPFGFGHLLPRGLLREPVAALSRAGVVVLTRAERVTPADLDRLEREVARHAGGPIAVARTVARGLEQAGVVEPPSGLEGRVVYACCGVGNPDAFARLLEDLGARVVGRRFLPDHGTLDDAGWNEVVAAARAAGADRVVTTRKDAVKVAALPPQVAVLDVAVEVVAGETALREALATALHRGHG